MLRHVLLCLPLGCGALADVAVGGVDFAGAKADAHCDRRFVDEGRRASAFCQEIESTVAAAEFSDDCRARHAATAGAGLCPRASIVAGCRLLEEHEDNSVVTDWYYDVTELQRDAGADAGPSIEGAVTTVEEVEALCADPSRYELGATFVRP